MLRAAKQAAKQAHDLSYQLPREMDREQAWKLRGLAAAVTFEYHQGPDKAHLPAAQRKKTFADRAADARRLRDAALGLAREVASAEIDRAAGESHDLDTMRQLRQIAALALRAEKAFARLATPKAGAAAFAAHFSAGDPQEQGGWVRRWAPLAFKAGTYDLPIGPFTVAPEHIRAAVEAQPPDGYPIGDEHNARSALMRRAGGSYGRAKLVPSPDYSAFGVEAWFPPPVHALLGPGPVGMSAHWCPLTKRLKQIDLTDNPRIDGAGLAALFSKEPDVTPTATPPAAPPAGTAPAPPPDLAARLAEMEKREADYKQRIEASEARQKAADAALAAERDKRLLAEAAKFGDAPGLGKDLRDLFAEGYFSLAADDREHGEATFSREGADAPRKGLRLDWLRRLNEKVRALPTVLHQDAYRGGAEFANDPGEKPGDEFKSVDEAVDAEIERQRKARGQQTNGRGA